MKIYKYITPFSWRFAQFEIYVQSHFFYTRSISIIFDKHNIGMGFFYQYGCLSFQFIDLRFSIDFYTHDKLDIGIGFMYYFLIRSNNMYNFYLIKKIIDK